MLHLIVFIYFTSHCLHRMWPLNPSRFVMTSQPKDFYLGCLSFCLIFFLVSTHIWFCFICNQAHQSCFPLIGRAAIWVLWSNIWMHLRINEINCWGEATEKRKAIMEYKHGEWVAEMPCKNTRMNCLYSWVKRIQTIYFY